MASNGTTGKDTDAYPLNRDFLASSRLNLQHRVWTTSLGYLLHPSIPMKKQVLVADIGCGTGISSLEIAKQLSVGGRVEGYDLSLEQCPPVGWWPENVTFEKLDIFEPIPERLAGRYDVVFLRHFICVVQSGNPMPLLSALLKLLKPSGHLQWQEWDLTTNKVVIVEPATSAPKMEAFMSLGGDAVKKQAGWVRNLHMRFDEVGAELIAHDRHRTVKEAMMMKQEINFFTVREWCERLRADDPASVQAGHLDRLANEAFDECLRQGRGTVIDCEMVTWVARKLKRA